MTAELMRPTFLEAAYDAQFDRPLVDLGGKVINCSYELGCLDPHCGRCEPWREELADRIGRRRQVDPVTGCWLYTGPTAHNKGYGKFSIRQRTFLAHRVAWHLRGRPPVPELDHLCRVRNCFNPDHLEPVTHTENVRRGISPASRQHLQTHCFRGHELPERKPDGPRVCLPCCRIWTNAYRAIRRRGIEKPSMTCCWACQYPFHADDLADLDGLPHCGPCLDRETGSDGELDRVRDL